MPPAARFSPGRVTTRGFVQRAGPTARAAFLLLLVAACGKAPTPDAAPSSSPAAAPATTLAPAPSPADATTPLADLALGTLISDQWYDVREDGRKTGWFHSVWRRSELDGRPTIHDRTESASAETRLMGGIEDVFASQSVTDLERAEDGTLLRMRTERTEGDRTTTSETRRDGDSYVFTQVAAGRTERHVVKTAEAVPVDTEAFLAPRVRRGEIAVGGELTYAATNFAAERIETVRLRVEAREPVATRTGTAECWRVLERVDGRPGEATWWIDDRGIVARQRQGTTSIERTTESAARRLDPSAAAFEITIPADPELPRATSLDRCVVEVEIRRAEGLDLPDFSATPFSREVSRDGDRIRVELTAYDDRAATVELPVKDAAFAKALEATNLYAPDSEIVRAAYAEAISKVPLAQRTDGRTVARALLRYVFATLRKQSGPAAQPTAPEILEARMGDCSEHAVLFVALCRAGGLPARRLTGYAQVGEMWGAHSFCEIWLGKWIGADPTTNELGTRARYLCFGWDENPDSYPGLVSQRCRGRMTIRTLEFTDGGTTMTTDEARERRPLREDLSGLVLANPPEGWTVRPIRGVGRATATGPGGDVTFIVSAGVGDLDVDLLRSSMFGSGRASKFCGRPALRVPGGFYGRGTVTFAVPWRRRTLAVTLRADGDGDIASLTRAAEALAAPMFAGAGGE